MRYIWAISSVCLGLSAFFYPPHTVLAASPVSEKTDRSLSVRKKINASERRVALIIGNSFYSDAPLKNPVNDADAMARVLRETGFDVTIVKNADRRKMFSSMNEFGRKLRKSDVGLFYYAGHGVQIDNANYLLPVDLKGRDIQETDDLRYNSFPLNELMDRMRDASTNNIIILDACRDNPFLNMISRSASRGLAKVSTPASTSILYSTDPGNTASDGVSGDNGVFTNRLVESIQKSGLELVEVMREVALNVTRDTNGAQRPVFDGVLSSKFYFREQEALKQPPAESPPSAITVDRQVMELRYWESAEKIGTASAYQSYLKKFPSGDFSELAKVRLEQIDAQKANDNTKTERDRLAKEKADLERSAKESAERTRLAEERADLERRMREAEAKARQGEERSKQSASDQARLAKEKADLERAKSELATKPQIVASLPSDKALKKETVKERIGNFLISDLTVTDETAGLTWVRDVNVTGKKNFDFAYGIVNKLNSEEYGGYNDWRLPNPFDFRSLYNSVKGESEKSKSTVVQVIDRLFVNYLDWGSWMSSGSPRYLLRGAGTYDLRYGTTNDQLRSDDALILLVRGKLN